MLYDEDLARAILDRDLERGRLRRLDGPSVRMLHLNLDEAMKEDSDYAGDVVRLSVKQRPEFREHTQVRTNTFLSYWTARGVTFTPIDGSVV